MEIISDAPTPSLQAFSGDIQENSAVLETNSKDSAVSTTNEVVNELECTGEPCEQDTWCRSMFGTCGPGFIYCNAKAIWTASCRLNQPVVTSSEESPSGPVATSQVESSLVVEENSSDAVPNVATSPVSSPSLRLPELPKPTLPTISDATTFKNQQAFAAHFATADSNESKEDDGTQYEDDGLDLASGFSEAEEAPDEPKDKEEEKSKANTYPTMYDSPEYAKQWSEWAKEVQSSAHGSYLNTMYFAVLSLSAMLLLCA
jgi:hypothetical protein